MLVNQLAHHVEFHVQLLVAVPTAGVLEVEWVHLAELAANLEEVAQREVLQRRKRNHRPHCEGGSVRLAGQHIPQCRQNLAALLLPRVQLCLEPHGRFIQAVFPAGLFLWQNEGAAVAAQLLPIQLASNFAHVHEEVCGADLYRFVLVLVPDGLSLTQHVLM